MPKEIRIYFEGSKGLRPGFDRFFRRATGLPVRSIAVGSRSRACDEFRIGLKRNPDAMNVLLIDSEGEPLADLARKLCPSHPDSVFWMVEAMESWFHADADALSGFYGRDFNRNALRRNRNVELIPKRDLEAGLSAATRHTDKRDYYRNKTLHGPALLALIDPQRVRAAAPNCKRLLEAIAASFD